MRNPQHLPAKDLHIRKLSFPQSSVLKSRYTNKLWGSADPLQSQVMFFLHVWVHVSRKRVYTFHQILKEKMCPPVPLPHPEAGTQLPICSRTQTDLCCRATWAGTCQVGSGVWVRLQIHGSCGQSIQEPQGSSNEPGTERWRLSHLDWGSPITLSQLEMFCVSNLFLLGRDSKAETITIPPAQTDTWSYTAGLVAS